QFASSAALTRCALSRALVDADSRSEKARMGNPAARGRAGRSDSLEAKRVGFALEFRADAVCLPWKEIRESRRLLADDEVARRPRRSARRVLRPRMESHPRSSRPDGQLRSEQSRRARQ